MNIDADQNPCSLFKQALLDFNNLQKLNEQLLSAQEARQRLSEEDENSRVKQMVESLLAMANIKIKETVQKFPEFVDYLGMVTKKYPTYYDKTGTFVDLPPILEVPLSPADEEHLREMCGGAFEEAKVTNLFSRQSSAKLCQLWPKYNQVLREKDKGVALYLAIPFDRESQIKLVFSESKLVLVSYYHPNDLSGEDYYSAVSSYLNFNYKELMDVLRMINSPNIDEFFKFFFGMLGIPKELVL